MTVAGTMRIDVADVEHWEERFNEFARSPVDPLLIAGVDKGFGHRKLVSVDNQPVLFLGGNMTSMMGNEVYLWLVPFKALRATHVFALRGPFEDWCGQFRRVWSHCWLGDTEAARFMKLFRFVPIVETPKGTFFERVTP